MIFASICDFLRYVGDSLCCLRFILPLIPQIFTDSIYSNIRVHPRYLWETPSHPISVLICAVYGRFLLLLEIYSPTDSTDIHRFYIFQYLCSSVLSVGDSLCCLRFILPLIPQIFTDSIYSNIRVHPRYLWETPSHPISVLICAICGRFLLLLEIYSPTDSTDFTDFIYPCIRVHLCYLWETPSPPISVFISDICGSHPLHLKIILPQIPRIFTLSLQKNTTQSHKLQNDQGKTMIAKDSFVPLL